MSARRIFNWLDALRVDDWYDQLEGKYGWNARYWEQRALAECTQRIPRYEKAEAWARKAVSCYEDAYSLNTLGKVLCRASLSYSGEFDRPLFEEGINCVRSAVDVMKRSSEYPYITALTYLTHAYSSTDRNGVAAEDLRRRFNIWLREAEDAEAFAFPHSRALLDQRRRKFLEVVAGADDYMESVFDSDDDPFAVA